MAVIVYDRAIPAILFPQAAYPFRFLLRNLGDYLVFVMLTKACNEFLLLQFVDAAAGKIALCLARAAGVFDCQIKHLNHSWENPVKNRMVGKMQARFGSNKSQKGQISFYNLLALLIGGQTP